MQIKPSTDLPRACSQCEMLAVLTVTLKSACNYADSEPILQCARAETVVYMFSGPLIDRFTPNTAWSVSSTGISL